MAFQHKIKLSLFHILVFFMPLGSMCQMITGTWKGRINRQRVEVKIIQQGDSLVGTSYYYESHSNYRRYTIKGYFDPQTNNAIWWDDQLIDEQSGRLNLSTPGKIPMLSNAEFNCPGGGRMMLDGNVSSKENRNKPSGEVHLDKSMQSDFEDEWDYVIDNYTVGTNDPDIIDSVAAISRNNKLKKRQEIVEESDPVIVTSPVKTSEPKKQESKNDEVKIRKLKTVELKTKEPKKPEPVSVVAAQSIEDKFVKREKVLVKEIPLIGDSLELRFYDNAEVDGDSISLFLNGRLLFKHIRLTAAAYTIKLPVAEMSESNELIMVAENLGSIPPNTSYMLAITGEKRYDAYLASTEGSSAMIRFVKPH